METIVEVAKRSVLHVGCGRTPLHFSFNVNEWDETRLDIDQDVNPDIISSILDMSEVADNSFDAVFSSHNLEHIFATEVPVALAEFHRVLKPGGSAHILVPDIQIIAKEVAKGNLEGFLYQSPAGPISPIDVLWGLRSGNEYMRHKTGFTAQTLGQKLLDAKFSKVHIDIRNVAYELYAHAIK